MIHFHLRVPLEGKLPYLGEVGTEEFLMKLTSQITEMVSAKFTQGKCMLRTILSVQLHMQLLVLQLSVLSIRNNEQC